MLSQNLHIPEAELSVLPESGRYIFPGTVPGPLEDDLKAVGGPAVASKKSFTFRMKSMQPYAESAGGSVRVVDSRNFPVDKAIAAALFSVKPTALREMHWHPKSEWQFYIRGSAQMTVFNAAGEAFTMDYHPDDVGLVPATAGHYILNTGNEDLEFLAVFKSDEFVEFSLDQWISRLPVQITQQTLNLSPTQIACVPNTKYNFFLSKKL